MQPLDPVEVRVLGALIEKEATTPEYYPLSMNALVAACNQKSNRMPVVEYGESAVIDAIERLRTQRFAAVVVSGSRVNKYAQRVSETLNLGRREVAAVCTLLLRGAQTLGEVKDRCERIYAFGDLEETERVLEKLAEWPGGGLVRKLERAAGQKEARYAHLFSGEPAGGSETASSAGRESVSGATRINALEAEIETLRRDVTGLEKRIAELEQLLR